ncbi:MAG: hypothetical protein GXY58_01170 [Planctomycetaceae bacterium]|nr:hypothetical protein [Planctomycetaceae bacterium]
MRKLLGTITLFMIVIAMVGSARKWFTMERTSQGDSTEVHLHIHHERIRSDTENAREVARELRENLGGKLDDRFNAPPQ